MLGESLKEEAKDLNIADGSRYAVLRDLIVSGQFDTPTPTSGVLLSIREQFGQKWQAPYVPIYMKKFLEAGIIRGVRVSGSHKSWWVLTCVTRAEALQAVAKSQNLEDVGSIPFPEELTRLLTKDFGHELRELQDNFGQNGNCSAFFAPQDP